MAVTKRKTQTDNNENNYQATILCVDDEPSILDALTRYCHARNWKAITAGSGAEGLQALSDAETNGTEIDIVISDMRMPNMSGAEFLTQVRHEYPGAMRILLTGYSDIDALASAVNDAAIFNYANKPWDENLLTELIRSALQTKTLEQERQHLQALTEQQNQQLKEANDVLDQRVAERTEELQKTLSKLESSHAQLNQTFTDTLKLLSHLMEWQEGKDNRSNGKLAKQAAAIGAALGLEQRQTNQLFTATLLKNIGMLGLPDQIRLKPMDELSEQELADYRKHPVLGEAALSIVPAMAEVASLIRGQHEKLDGSGFPDGLEGDQLSLPTRILSVLGDFHDLELGLKSTSIEGTSEALEFVRDNTDKLYDARVIAQLERHLTGDNSTASPEMTSTTQELLPGMTLARDIISETGIMLLAQGAKLTESTIGRIRKFEADTKSSLEIVVYQQEDESVATP